MQRKVRFLSEDHGGRSGVRWLFSFFVSFFGKLFSKVTNFADMLLRCVIGSSHWFHLVNHHCLLSAGLISSKKVYNEAKCLR